MAAKDKEISSFRKRKLKVEMREQMQVNRHKFFFNWLNNTNPPRRRYSSYILLRSTRMNKI